MKTSFEVVVKKTAKGFQGQLIFTDVTITSHPHYFQTELEAKEWLVATLNAYQQA